MTFDLNWWLQVLILAGGIYVFLRFLRTTRGSGVLRGLLVAFAVGVIGLWGVSEYLRLEGLQHLIQGVTPYLAVILVILFQPELRRAIAQLGESERFGLLLGGRRQDTVHEVVQAALDMASRRHGALIAFQREAPLDAWTQSAVRVDSDVRKLLIESIFHPGSSLHDGGMVISDDRVVAAACIFPLTENTQLSKSTGTRHRAGLGLSEETDAVVLIVSEETGSIALCHRGQMDRHVPAERLEPLLLERLGFRREGDGARASAGARLGRMVHALTRSARSLFTQDLMRKAAALAVSLLLLFLSYRQITESRTFQLRVVSTLPGAAQPAGDGEFEIRLPGSEFHLVSPTDGTLVEVEVLGTRATLEGLGARLRGVLTVGDDVPEGGLELATRDVVWSAAGRQLDVDLSWTQERAPKLEVQRFAQIAVDVEPGFLSIDDALLDPRLQAPLDQVVLSPEKIEVRGPRQTIAELATGSLPLRFETVTLEPQDRRDRNVQLRLSPALRERGLEVAAGVRVTAQIRIIPARRSLGTVEKFIHVFGDPAETSETEQVDWTVSTTDQVARFRVETAGIIPADAEPGQQAYQEDVRIIEDYVREELKVYVEVVDLNEQQGGTTVPVRKIFPPEDWRKVLGDRLGKELHEYARLEVVLDSEDRVRLTRREGSNDD